MFGLTNTLILTDRHPTRTANWIERRHSITTRSVALYGEEGAKPNPRFFQPGNENVYVTLTGTSDWSDNKPSVRWLLSA